MRLKRAQAGLVLLVFLSNYAFTGCNTAKQAKAQNTETVLKVRREEVEVLYEEIGILLGQLLNLQTNLAAGDKAKFSYRSRNPEKKYVLENQIRDVDKQIETLVETKRKLIKERDRLRDEFNLPFGCLLDPEAEK